MPALACGALGKAGAAAKPHLGHKPRSVSCCAATVSAEDSTQTVARPTVSMVSLGCPKNTVDGEVMLGDLVRNGFAISDDHEKSDAIIINTCAFVEDAKSESLETILEAVEMRANAAGKRVIITGCLAQRYAQDLAEQLPEVDMFVGFENYRTLPERLKTSLGMVPEVDFDDAPARSRVQVGESTVPFRPEWDRHRLTPPHTAYMRVAEGCNHACTFCAIPGFRGKFRSKAWTAVLEEARVLVESGVKELNLIAEDTNQYGMDRKDGKGLAQLLQELSKLEGLRWIRILYAYPSYFSEDLIDEIASNPKVCKYIDMPLQHISNLTLLGMNRPARDYTETLLRKLRDRIPGLALRTTFICGFPGETEAQHRELVDFCREFRFERMGAFAYSEEDGTPAAEMAEQVHPDERQQRRDELIALQQKIGTRWAKRMVGKEIDVLVDGYDEDGVLVGRTEFDAPDIDHLVLLTDSSDESIPRLEAGQMRRVLITDNITFDLVGQPTC